MTSQLVFLQQDRSADVLPIVGLWTMGKSQLTHHLPDTSPIDFSSSTESKEELNRRVFLSLAIDFINHSAHHFKLICSSPGHLVYDIWYFRLLLLLVIILMTCDERDERCERESVKRYAHSPENNAESPVPFGARYVEILGGTQLYLWNLYTEIQQSLHIMFDGQITVNVITPCNFNINST